MIIVMKCRQCGHQEDVPGVGNGIITSTMFGSQIDFCTECGVGRDWNYPDQEAVDRDPFDPKWDHPKYCDDFVGIKP